MALRNGSSISLYRRQRRGDVFLPTQTQKTPVQNQNKPTNKNPTKKAPQTTKEHFKVNVVLDELKIWIDRTDSSCPPGCKLGSLYFSSF